jgi:hypothetical protein
MNKEELKTLVKKYFKLTEIETTVENNNEVKEKSFDSAKLVDGTEITNMSDDEFEVGQELHVITEDGTHVIAPSGEHTTESGITIVVDGEGKITGVSRPDESGQGSLAEDNLPATEAMSTEDTVTKEQTNMEEEVIIEENLEERDVREVIIEAIAEVVAPEIEAMKKKMAEIDEKMNKYMSKPADVPTAEKQFSRAAKKNVAKSEVLRKDRYALALNRINNKNKS